MEYCCVVYVYEGRGFTQQIKWVRIQGEEVIEWKGKYWTDFLNHMAQKQWELVTIVYLENVFEAYFKRPIQTS